MRQEMVTVFVPSSPTAFTGYVLMVPAKSVVELPMTVDQAMRMLVSGGVIGPELAAIEDAIGLEDADLGQLLEKHSKRPAESSGERK